MRKFGMTTALLFLAAVMALAQSSLGDKAQGAASSAGGAVKSGAEQTGGAVKSGAESTKNAVTGSSEQSTDQNQNQGTPESQSGAQTGANPKAGAHHGGLPQTGSPLPLLGLLGAGAVGFGTWKARFFRR